MSYPLVVVAACVAPACTREALTEVPYDRRMGVCFEQHLKISITDAPEFNSQPPFFYATQTGKRDRPYGYGKPATFHYVKNPSFPITPEEHYAALWQITHAAAPPLGS